MGRKHSYKDYNITIWITPKGGAWEYVTVISGPMSTGKYKTVKLNGTSTMPTDEGAFEFAYEAAIKHIDML